jgi:hypothetical protein
MAMVLRNTVWRGATRSAGTRAYPLIERLEGRRLLSASSLPTSYLINCGGTAPYTDHNGHTWSADEDFAGGTVSDTRYTVPGTADGIVFYERRTGTSFSYSLPLANGKYVVQFFFTDPIYSAAGQRKFNVAINNTIVLKNFDIIAAGGGKAPLAKAFNATITNNDLALNFTATLNNATVSGIQVMPVSPTPTPPPTPTPTPTPTHPYVLNVKTGTASGTTNVPVNAFVAADIEIVHPGFGIDSATVNASTVELYPTAQGASHPVPAQRNIDGAGAEIVDQPVSNLQPDTQYTFAITSGVKDLTGATMTPFTYTFTTGASGSTTGSTVAFNKVTQSTTDGKQYTDITIGPDGRLWASTLNGLILAFPISSSGNLGSPQTYKSVQNANGGAETIIGITFDPASTAADPLIWVDESQYTSGTAADFTGKIALLKGPNLAYQDMVVGLPRSIGNHQTNQSTFGPDGALYVSQGSNTGLGAPDPIWGYRAENLLNAAILRVNTKALEQRIAAGQGPLNVKTKDGGGTYDPYAAGAPLTLYATGIRNCYDILFASNGHLYAPTNGSAAGSTTPAAPGLPKTGIANIKTTEWDWLFDVKPGKYYGHPDPARGQYILNDGNAGNAKDPLELAAYPVGTKPDPNYQGPVYTFGPDYSPRRHHPVPGQRLWRGPQRPPAHHPVQRRQRHPRPDTQFLRRDRRPQQRVCRHHRPGRPALPGRKQDRRRPVRGRVRIGRYRAAESRVVVHPAVAVYGPITAKDTRLIALRWSQVLSRAATAPSSPRPRTF